MGQRARARRPSPRLEAPAVERGGFGQPEIRLHRESGHCSLGARGGIDATGAQAVDVNHVNGDVMAPTNTAAARSGVLRSALGAGAAALALAIAVPASAADQAPIKIGVIAEAQAVAGSSIPQAAQLAADEINANGGVDGRKIEIVAYDNHSSAAESVRAFQRAVSEDKSTPSSRATSARSCWRSSPGPARLKTRHDHAGRGVRRHHPEHRQGLRAQQIHLPRLPDLERARRARLRRRQGPAGRRPAR